MLDIAVVFLGELVGKLDGVEKESHHYWARKGSVAFAYPAEQCDLVPYEVVDWNSIYNPPSDFVVDSVITLEKDYCI